MALNKFMHTRNIYKTPPDFEKMMKTFSEFSGIAKMVGGCFCCLYLKTMRLPTLLMMFSI